MRWIMSLYHHYLFQTSKPKIFTDISDIDIINKKVLLIDDVVHTGATIDVVLDYLKNSKSLDIKTASLSYVSKRKPDFHVLPKGNYCFPWSKDF